MNPSASSGGLEHAANRGRGGSTGSFLYVGLGLSCDMSLRLRVLRFGVRAKVWQWGRG